jgi:hypothetical protein
VENALAIAAAARPVDGPPEAGGHFLSRTVDALHSRRDDASVRGVTPMPAAVIALDARRRQARVDGTRRRVGTAMAGSLALHALAVGLLAAMTSLGEGGRSEPFGGQPIVATLVSAPTKFVVPPSQPEAARRAETVTSAPGGERSILPLPLKRSAPVPVPAGTPEGVATMQVLEEPMAPEPALDALLRGLHPQAVRVAPVFVVEPSPVYPREALPERRQYEQTVVVVIDEHGRVAALDGTLGVSPFDRSIRAALAQARAQPALVDGQPRVSWTLARFAYEFVGVRQ